MPSRRLGTDFARRPGYFIPAGPEDQSPRFGQHSHTFIPGLRSVGTDLGSL